MAFDLNKLVLVGDDGNSGSGRSWRYKTEDTHATVRASGYMDPAAGLLLVTDVITVIVVTNIDSATEAVATYGDHIVLTIASGVVDLSDETVKIVANT